MPRLAILLGMLLPSLAVVTPPPRNISADPACFFTTSRLLFTPQNMVGNTIVDPYGKMNATAVGKYNVSSSGVLTLDGSSGTNVTLGNRTFGGAMTFVFWGMFTGSSGNSMRLLEWSQPNAQKTNLNDIVVKNAGSNALTCYTSFTFNGSVGPAYTYSASTCPSNPVLANVWTHFALTISPNGTNTLYLNGTAVGSNSSYLPPVTWRVGYLGASSNGNIASNAPIGMSDFQMMNNYTATATDVQNMFLGKGCPQSPSPPPPSPRDRKSVV